jgi:hypothetical protein
MRWLAVRGHYKVLCALLENGGKIMDKVPRGAPTLHLTAEGGYEDAVRRIVEIEDVGVNAVGKTGHTPLLCACPNWKGGHC